MVQVQGVVDPSPQFTVAVKSDGGAIDDPSVNEAN
jgi:hypothetical protein